MICKRPFVKDGLSHGCGQCLPCLINKRRKWTNRIMLESLMHTYNSFVTLTYENLPLCTSVCSRHLSLFMKNLRSRTDYELRFFASAEYGDPEKGVREWNPHYHIALFGYPSCINGIPIGKKQCLCPNCKPIFDSWKRGRTFNAILETDSAQYIAQYVTKKMTNKHDPRLEGRSPEFSRMSRRPGIGAPAIDKISKIIDKNKHCVDDLDLIGDVIPHIWMGKKKLPLDRYLRNRLRKSLGRDEGLPDELLDALKTEKYLEKLELRSTSSSYQKYGEKLNRSALANSLEKQYKLKEMKRLTHGKSVS